MDNNLFTHEELFVLYNSLLWANMRHTIYLKVISYAQMNFKRNIFLEHKIYSNA